MSKKSAEDFKKELIDNMMSGGKSDMKVMKVSSIEELQDIVSRISSVVSGNREQVKLNRATLEKLREECRIYREHREHCPFKIGDIVTQRAGHGNRKDHPAIVVEVNDLATPVFYGPEPVSSSGFGPIPNVRVLTIVGDDVAMFWTESSDLRLMDHTEFSSLDANGDAA